jgi:CRP-like cAMP-binding protein
MADSSSPRGVTQEDLARIPLFSVASRKALEALAAGAQILDLAAGERVFSEGDLPDSVYLIDEGEVEIFKEADGERKALRSLGPGHLLGELGVMAGNRRTAAAETTGQARVWAIDRETFVDVFKSEPSLAIAVARTMAPYLMDEKEIADDLLRLDLRARVAKRLFAVASKTPAEEGATVTLRLSPTQIAMMAGGLSSDVETVLNEFEAAGTIARRGEEIDVVDPGELAALADL